MNRTLFFGLTGVALAAGLTAHMLRDRQLAYTPRHAMASADKGIKGAQEYLSMLRRNLNTGEVNPGDNLAMRKAVEAFERTNSNKAVGLNWIEMGPNNIGGRIRAIAVDPGTPGTLWAGGVSGGLWKSTNSGNTWSPVPAFNSWDGGQGLNNENLCISSIAILGNGHIYVATGNTFESPSGSGGSGFLGGGLFRSLDNGATFEPVPGATPTNFFNGSDWSIVNKIERHRTEPNKLWVGSDHGLKLFDEGSNSFSNVGPSAVANQLIRAMEISSDGQTMLVGVATDAYRSTDGGQNFELLDGTPGSGFPQTGIGRLEFAISPDDANYMYAMACDAAGRMSGVWASTDKGNNWTRIWPPGFGTNGVEALDIFRDNQQGFYDNVLAVRPGHPDELWLGGVELWKTTIAGPPVQLAIAQDFVGCFFCVHADVHEITFLDAQTCFVGCDGGVYRTDAAGQFFLACNRDLNITQFYSVAYDAKGRVSGGTQDNGSLYIPLNGNTVQESVDLTGGDGFDADISQLDGNIMFTSIYGGAVFRSSDGGNNFGDFYSNRITDLGEPGDLANGLGDFYTNLRLYEDPYDENSQDSLDLVKNTKLTDTLIVADVVGTPFNYISANCSAVPLTTTWQADWFPPGTDTLFPGDSLKLNLRLWDPVQSLFAVGFAGTDGVWVTRDALNFNKASEWWQVAGNSQQVGNVNCIEWSADGNHLFIGNTSGEIYRVSGFNTAYDSASADLASATRTLTGPTLIHSGSAIVTGLAPGPQDGNDLVATFGNYGGSQKVKRTSNALAGTVSWSNIWNVPSNIAGMPVYDAIVHAEDPDIVVVGTEFGIWATDDGGATWAVENNGLGKVPVFALRQQRWNWQNNPYSPDYVTNPYVIYAGTHGRGIFRTETLLGVGGPIGDGGSSSPIFNGLTIFPNPATANEQVNVNFNLRERTEVSVTVYDMTGRVVRTIARRSMPKGDQRLGFDVNGLGTGTYILELRAGDARQTGRFVVRN
ncbi:MAG: T9SS type A sorting domain-containing protein [Flavobacteriales bacterium]|nr:T9SS type A sorting domain-containing protein [Flavobacteriales bacterium]